MSLRNVCLDPLSTVKLEYLFVCVCVCAELLESLVVLAKNLLSVVQLANILLTICLLIASSAMQKFFSLMKCMLLLSFFLSKKKILGLLQKPVPVPMSGSTFPVFVSYFQGFRFHT